jgi:hypothetical protein
MKLTQITETGIRSHMPIYFGLFSSIDDVIHEFEIASSELKDAEIIYAEYDTANYEGDAFVIFVRDGLIFEVHGSHCSCRGLENCWSPEQVSLQGLMFRHDVPKQAKDNLKQRFPTLMPLL